MEKMTNEQYWLRRDRTEKMESLYGRPIGFPEDELNPRPGIVQNLVFFRSAGWDLHDCLFYLH